MNHQEKAREEAGTEAGSGGEVVAPGAMTEPITFETLKDLARRGAVRVTLKDGRSFVVSGPSQFWAPPEFNVLYCAPFREGLFITRLDQVERAEPVWPDEILLAD
jgi:hypothetical protein